jgi:hypothetical protein
MKKADLYKLAKLLHDKVIPGITAIPAVLYFPHEVVDQLNEICRVRGLTPGQLMAEVLKAQRPRFDQFVEDVMKPRKPGEPTAWPKDPLYCLACGTMRHFARNFMLLQEDPVAFEQMRKDAPVDWSFRSLEELEADEPADWWKGDESE